MSTLRLGTRVALVVGGTCALAACAGQAGQLGSTLPRRIEAPGPAAPRYETARTPGSVRGAEKPAEQVAKGVRQAARKQEVDLRGDGRLAQLAAWTAEHLGEGGAPPPHKVVQFFAQHLGLVEPTPHLLIRGQPVPGSLHKGVADSVSQFLARQPYNRWGAAVIRRQDLRLAIVALSKRVVNLGPVPRRLDVGRPIRLEGELHAGYRNAKLAVATPSGDVIRRKAGTGPRFEAEIATSSSGTYNVELLADGPHGSTVIANFPVYVGVDPPTSISLEPRSAGAESGDTQAIKQRLLRHINRTRAEHGAPPVRSHTGLDRVAAAHSRDMAKNDFVGHESPSTGSAPERVERAGYSSGLVLENIGRGYSAQGIHRGLMKSPGHRANILNPDVTHVGIGVVAEDDGNRQAYLVTQLFVRMTQEIDVARAPHRLVDMINRHRRTRDAQPLEPDDNLMKVAQRAAEQFFDKPELDQRGVIANASSRLKRFSIAFKRVGGVMAVVNSLGEAARLEPTLNPEVRYVGIGVAQGSRPDTQANSIAVVVMLGWPRE